MCLYKEQPVEGVRLTLMTCQETPNKHIFMKYLNMFIEADNFAPGMTPFVDRSLARNGLRILSQGTPLKLQRNQVLCGGHF